MTNKPKTNEEIIEEFEDVFMQNATPSDRTAKQFAQTKWFLLEALQAKDLEHKEEVISLKAKNANKGCDKCRRKSFAGNAYICTCKK